MLNMLYWAVFGYTGNDALATSAVELVRSRTSGTRYREEAYSIEYEHPRRRVSIFYQGEAVQGWELGDE